MKKQTLQHQFLSRDLLIGRKQPVSVTPSKLKFKSGIEVDDLKWKKVKTVKQENLKSNYLRSASSHQPIVSKRLGEAYRLLSDYERGLKSKL